MIRLNLFLLVAGLLSSGCAATPPEPPKAETRITYAVQKADLRTAVEQIARRGNLSVILDADVPGTLSMSLNEVPPRDALEAVAKTFSLKVTDEPSGIIRISKP